MDNTRFNSQVLRSYNASSNKLRAVQGVKAIVAVQILDSLTFTSYTRMVYGRHRYEWDRQEHATWAWTPWENSKPNLLRSSACPPGQTTHHPILFLRRHEEPHDLLTSRRYWEDAVLRLQGTRVLPPWGFAGQRHWSKHPCEWADQQICTDVR